MKYIDIKHTVWERIHFSEDTDMQEKIKEIEEGRNAYDGYNEDEGFLESEILYDTFEYILPEDNDNQPTIEIYEGIKFQDIIWDNLNGKV